MADRSMLLTKGRIGSMELKNRVVMAPMGTTADGDGGYPRALSGILRSARRAERAL